MMANWEMSEAEFIPILKRWIDEELKKTNELVAYRNYDDSYFEATLKGKRDTLKQVKEKIEKFFP